MSDTPAVPSSAVAALGLTGGFLARRWTGRRDLAGALFAAAGAWCAREWYRASGLTATVGLSALYAAAMGGSHPLAKRIGAWPSVLAVTAVTVAAAELVTRTAAPDWRLDGSPREPAFGRRYNRRRGVLAVIGICPPAACNPRTDRGN